MENNGIIICEKCYEENESTRTTCKACGAKLYKNNETDTDDTTETNNVNETNSNKVSLIRCEVCGKRISENAVSCPNCGAKNRNNTEKASTGVKVICFLIPIVGIIIFAVNISTKPKYAKGCLIASLLPTLIALIIILMLIFSTTATKQGGVITKTKSSLYNSGTSSSSTYLPYCKYTGCYNRVSYSWLKYCDDHSYME